MNVIRSIFGATLQHFFQERELEWVVAGGAAPTNFEVRND